MTGAGLICILTSEKSPVMDDVTDFPSQGEKHYQSFAYQSVESPKNPAKIAGKTDNIGMLTMTHIFLKK